MIGNNRHEHIKNENHRKKTQEKSNVSAGERREIVGKNLSFGATEAYKLLRTSLMFSVADEGSCKIIGVTSSLRGEGKSTTSVNLAYTLAQSGKNTLIMEADMRIPVQAGNLQIDASPGLSHVLTGMNTLTEAIHQPETAHRLSVIPAGEIPPNPSELLSSKTMGIVMKSLAKVFDYIIVDLPPISAVSDALVVSKLLTGMVVVVRQNYCDRQSLAETMRRLEMLGVKVLGFVFNGAEVSKNKYYKYKYEYTQKNARKDRKKTKKSVFIRDAESTHSRRKTESGTKVKQNS